MLIGRLCRGKGRGGLNTANSARVRDKILLCPEETVSAGDVASNPISGADASPPKAVTLSSASPAVGVVAATPPSPPPAAATVANGEVTEETLLLRQKLETAEAARRKIEMDHASVSDEFQRYKDATEARATPVAVPVNKGKVAPSPSYRFLRRR